MNHRSVIARLPWYLARSLDDAEAVEVREHLDRCGDCRAELVRVRAAARLYSAEHPTPAELVDAAWKRLEPRRASEVAEHAAECRACREELALAEASRDEERQLEGAGLEAPSVAGWTAMRRFRPWAVAASVLLVAAFTLVVGLRIGGRERRALQADVESLRERVDGAVAATGRADERAAELETQVAALLAPRAGLPLVELLPDSVLRGKRRGEIAQVERSAADFVILVVALEDPRRSSAYTARLVDAQGREVFAAPAAAVDATGALNLLVPTRSLPLGSATIEVSGESGGPVLARYRLSIRGEASEPNTTNEAQ